MIPTFASGAVYGVGIISPSASLLSTGYVAGNTLSAQFLNFYLWGITAELNSVLAAGSVAQNSIVSNQVLTALQNITGTGYTVLSSGSPYSAAAVGGAYVVTATPFTFKLPAATGSGDRIRVINGKGAVAGLITVTPNGTDAIANAGNVSVFLQNVDQGGNPTLQWIELTDNVAGTWDVTGGQFCPAQSVDTNGSQYHLGKFHHLPLGNTTSRQIGTSVIPAAVGSFTAAIQGTGALGIPSGAKAVRVRVDMAAVPSSTPADCSLQVAFSDNVADNPSGSTAHPQYKIRNYLPSGATIMEAYFELDIPVNGSGQFFMFTVASSNTTLSSCFAYFNVVGYYMGD